jgi:hypothetical protein
MKNLFPHNSVSDRYSHALQHQVNDPTGKPFIGGPSDPIADKAGGRALESDLLKAGEWHYMPAHIFVVHSYIGGGQGLLFDQGAFFHIG